MISIRCAAAAVALGALAVSACVACSTHDQNPTTASLPPAAGKVAVVVAPPKGATFQDGDVTVFGSVASGNRLTVDQGTLLVTKNDGGIPGSLQRIDLLQRSFKLRLPESDPGFANDSQSLDVVAEPDGSLLMGRCASVERQAAPGKEWVPIAGKGCTSSDPRPDGTPVPATVSASDVRFSKNLDILGRSADGAVLIADLNVIWSLNQGTVTRLYEAPAGTHIAAAEGAVGAVTSQGNVIFGELDQAVNGRSNGPYLMQDLHVLYPDGHVAALDVPASIPGVVGDPRELAVGTIIGDGDGGLLYRVGDPKLNKNEDYSGVVTNNYVVREQGGRWSVLAAAHGSENQQAAAKWPSSGTTAATTIPVQLPVSMAVLPGMLIMSDGLDCNYALAIGLPH